MHIRVHSPGATRVSADVYGEPDGAPSTIELAPDGDGGWVGDVEDGCTYVLVAEGPTGHRFAPDRGLLDPHAVEVFFPPGHRRAAARPGPPPNRAIAPRAVARRWVGSGVSRRTTRPLVVYEAHIRGWTIARDRDDAGTFAAAIDELDRLAALGVSVVELLPVHQFDPDEDNYWGYMPLVFGAVHRRYARASPAEAELARFVAAAHERDIEVWLDVVFNHTTEEDDAGPLYNLRGLADDDYYVLDDRGAYIDDAGTGNTIDATSPAVHDLVMTALDRFASLGVDGFRFDLATVLTRDPVFVRRIGDWAVERGVRLVAEPWDTVRYQVGSGFPDDRWRQWNDRFRDDVRGFLRGEPGLVPAVMQRVAGSPDLFADPGRSVNFLTAHDGFTMYDLVAYDRKHNEANGWDNRDGTDDNRSWNCGWEGDDGVPEEVLALRHRQLRNAWCLLACSRGVPMFVAGDECGRTQRGNNNAYNHDDDVSWFDWGRAAGFADLEAFATRVLALRAAVDAADGVECFGVDGAPDTSFESRSLAWRVGSLYVMANMWWEPLRFVVQAAGDWSVLIDTADPEAPPRPAAAGSVVEVGLRSIIVLERR